MKNKVAAASCVLLGLILSLAGGCAEVRYLSIVAAGELDVLLNSRPIEDVLTGESLTDEQTRRLELIVAAREFARARLSLEVGDSYSTFHDTHGQTLAYNLSAARQDSLTPKSWWFPFVGEIDYLGFFSLAEGEQAEAWLKREGYDTALRAVDAYSTLGWLPDPVHSPMLERGDASLVDTVIHELAHNTVYATGHSDFNESLAMFIGRVGAELFYEEQIDATPEELAALREWYADQDAITAWLLELYDLLATYYAQDISSAEKIAGRETVFQTARDHFTKDVLPTLNEPERYTGWGNLPTNNAWVRLYRRYNYDLDVFAAVYEQAGRDFAAFLDHLRAAAGTADPMGYIRGLAAEP
ncbi:MAG: aminopeptidase [Planctomycetes bacterium]|nr:aminopeptidase [Planctomycetota bacterium]